MFQVCTGAARRWRESSHGFSAGWSGVRNTVPNRMSSHAALHRTVVSGEAWGVAASRLNRFAPPQDIAGKKTGASAGCGVFVAEIIGNERGVQLQANERTERCLSAVSCFASPEDQSDKARLHSEDSASCRTLLPWRDAEISYRCVFALSVSSLPTALARNGQRRFSSDSWPGTRASSVHQASAQSVHRPAEKV